MEIKKKKKKIHMYVCNMYMIFFERWTCKFLFRNIFFSNILKLAKEKYNCVVIGFYFFLFLIRLKIISVL